MKLIRVLGPASLLCVLGLCSCDNGGQSVPVRNTGEGGAGDTPERCKEGETAFEGECLVPATIKLDTVGYLPSRVKRATIPATATGDEFRVRNIETDEVAFTGTLGEPQTNADTGDDTRLADFSALTETGQYRMEVGGLPDSPPFEIAEDVFVEVIQTGMLAFYGQRCGVSVSFDYGGSHFEHAACHLEDGFTLDGEARDGTGGWHDAGDYGKYTINAAFSLAFLLKAWEDFGPGLGAINHIPDYDGDLPAWLLESRFQMDQLLKMQLPDGSASHMIGPSAFPGFIMPEDDLAPRTFTGPGTGATADLAAVAAMAARVFQPFDAEYAETCLTAALDAEAFLAEHPENMLPDFAGFTHSAYGNRSDTDDRFWAAVELWKTTKDDSRLSAIEASVPGLSINWDWAGAGALGVLDYAGAVSEARDPTVLLDTRAKVKTSADTLVENTQSHAYGRGIGEMYYWGVNGVVARSVMNLMVAHSIEPNDAYLDAAVQQIDHLLGRNPFGRSFVTGVGYFPANKPHHRPTSADSASLAWPGLLVGGPNPQNHPKAEVTPDLAPGLFWWDDPEDYTANEIAINWNAALVYALAALVPQ